MTSLQFGIPIVALSLGVATTGMTGRDENGEVRSPAVAGQFYPESATILTLAIEKFMADALPPQTKKPLAKSLILRRSGPKSKTSTMPWIWATKWAPATGSISQQACLSMVCCGAVMAVM